MKILVTGGAGYIGSHVVLELLRRGNRVVVIDKLERGNVEAIERASDLAGHSVDLRRGDLCDRAFMAGVLSEGFDCVTHVAAYKSVAESVAHPELYERNNTQATATLVHTMAEVGLSRVVYASTGSVYGDVDGAPVPETAPTAPMSPYASTKLAGERLVQREGWSSVSLRFFNVCGADESGHLGEFSEQSTNLMPVALEAVAAGRPVTIFGDDYPTPDGTCVRDYVHVSDIARGIALAVDQSAHPGHRVYNLGTGRGSSVRELLDAVGHAWGHPLQTRIGDRRPGDPASVVADVTKAKAELDFVARYDLQAMAESAVRWARRTAR